MDHDITFMTRSSFFICVTASLLLLAGAASAQSPNSLVGGSQFNPPPPSPPNVPKITVPEVPKFDVPSRPISQSVPAPSFSEKVSRCVDESALEGRTQSDRAAYTRSCVNR